MLSNGGEGGVFVGKPFDTKDIMTVIFPANVLANVLTKLNNTGKCTTQYNSTNLNN